MKNKEDLEIRKVLAGINKNVAKKSWECIVSGCGGKAINSHLLQRHGVLSNIVENGHCYELRETDIFGWSKDKPPVEFKRCGLQNALSLEIFCERHDNSLFKSIETEPVDYDDYKNQLLLSYRAVCAEIRRKELIIERFKRYLRSNILMTYRADYLDIVSTAVKGNESGIRDLMFYKEALEKEIEKPLNRFFFVHYVYPIKGIYASSHFTISNLDESSNNDAPIPDCIGHAIPNENGTELIFGYHKNFVNKAILDFVGGWKDLSIDQLGEKLTGWFTLIESWGMSPSLYARIKPENMSQYLGVFGSSTFMADQNPNVGFNMFEGLL